MQRIIFFGYSAGRMIRTDTTTTVNGRAPADIIAAMAPGAGAGFGGGGGGFGPGGGPYGGGGGGGPYGGGGGRFGGGRGPYGAGPSGLGAEDPSDLGGPGLPGGFPGGFPGGVGGATQQAAPVEARFRSTTTVEYVAPGR
jgi:hypothetical protein